MARMNTNIPLAGAVPNILGAMDNGALAAQRANEIQTQNSLRAYMQEQGPAMFAGDTNALRGYAQFDPMGAFNMQTGFDDRAWNAEMRDMERQRFGMDQQRFNAEMNPPQDENAFISQVLTGASYFHAQGDQQGYQDFLAQNGVDPAAVPFEAFPAIAGQLGIFDAGDLRDMAAPPDAQSAIAKLNQDLVNGLITPEEYQIAMQNFAPTGMTIESTPGGGFRVVQGAGVGADGGNTFVPSDPALMIQNIDAILNDPGLPYATGRDGPWRSSSPFFPEAYRVGTRMDQLEGQAFLQAFESLKGAGQITEIEGAKATMAVGRLNRGMSEEDYRAALLELRQVLSDAARRPQGWANTPEGIAEAQRQASGQNQPPAPAVAPVGQSQFVPTAAPTSPVGAPVGAPSVTVNANGPAITGPITAETIRNMTPMQWTEWEALNGNLDMSTLPDDVVRAIAERGE